MGKQVWSAIGGGVVAAIGLVAIVFFWKNPFREGEITITTPTGSSMTVKVANSNEISELIRKGLEDNNSANYLTNALLSIVEHLPSGSTLREKLVELAEHRRGPFSFSSVPVEAVYDPSVKKGFAAVCENSGFLAKNIVMFFLGDDDRLLSTPISAYADATLTFPCPSGGEIVRINAMEVQEFKGHEVLAKRTL